MCSIMAWRPGSGRRACVLQPGLEEEEEEEEEEMRRPGMKLVWLRPHGGGRQTLGRRAWWHVFVRLTELVQQSRRPATADGRPDSRRRDFQSLRRSCADVAAAAGPAGGSSNPAAVRPAQLACRCSCMPLAGSRRSLAARHRPQPRTSPTFRTHSERRKWPPGDLSQPPRSHIHASTHSISSILPYGTGILPRLHLPLPRLV